MKTILFVCTGNIFRSMIAEYALKAALGATPPYVVKSAGTVAQPQAMLPHVKEYLRTKGIDPSGHQQRKLTAALLNEADLVVTMGMDHRAYVKQHFEREALLFNQICCDQEESVLDVWEAVPNWESDSQARLAYIASVVDHICGVMPIFISNLKRLLDEERA